MKHPARAIRRIAIAPEELHFEFLHAAGPGGQNVNKVASAVRLRFDLRGSQSLPERTKARLRALAGNRLTADGVLLIAARSHRTQAANRREALERLHELIERAAIEPKQRVATRPTTGSQRRRLDGKRRHQLIKRLRGTVSED